MPDHDQRPHNKLYIDVNGYQAFTRCDRCTAIGNRQCKFLLRSDIRSRTDMKRLLKCSKCNKDSRQCIVEGENVLRDEMKEFGNSNRVGNGGRRMVKLRTGDDTTSNPNITTNVEPAQRPAAVEPPVPVQIPVQPVPIPVATPAASVPQHAPALPAASIAASTPVAPPTLSPLERLKLVQQTQRLLQHEVEAIIAELQAGPSRAA